VNIKLVLETADLVHSTITGGEYAIADLTIFVDTNLPYPVQKDLVIHSVIENYCMSWTHDKVEELTDHVMLALDLLDEEREG
jgi:hypothetical protein